MPQALLTIDNGILLNLLNDAKFRNAFPTLGQAQAELGAPSCCATRAQIHKAQTLAGMRRQVIALPASKKIEFKRFLNAQKVRISVPGANGKTTMYTF